MTATADTQVAANGNDARARGEVLPAISGPRLPYHPLIEQRFGIDRASWKALVEAIYPNASCVESVILALSYCRARKLDPFKRCVHIVAIWSKELGRLVDTVWPGIGELRTTAFRTGEYAGRDRTEYGPDITQKVGSATVTFPEWAQVTVHRMIKGQKVAFSGPQVYWLETYATAKRNDDTPNEMWATRPRGQIDKCAEAAALRAGFPEEIGGEYIPEEVAHPAKSTIIEGKAVQTLDELTDKLEGPSPPQQTAATEAEEDAEAQAETNAQAAAQVEPTTTTTTPEPAAPSIDDMDAGFAACADLQSVSKWERELLTRPHLTEQQTATVTNTAETARERIRKTRGSKAIGGKQKELAGT